MTIPDFTILIALDAEHLGELAISFRTWCRHKPQLLSRPIVFVIDVADPGVADDAVLLFGGPNVRYILTGLRPHASQREKMLAGLVFDGPGVIETPYYLKLDTDVIATTGCESDDEWIDANWFRDSPAIVSNSWHYTKPASMLADFNAWADRFPQEFPLRIDSHVTGRIAKHRRIISYVMFGRTDWTRRMAELAGDRLPCPSQDTFLGGCAVRAGERIQYAPFKDLGWRHIGGGGRRLEEAARQAMEGAGV